MVRVLFALFLLSACGVAPQKSLAPMSGIGDFESAFVETGNDSVARSVAHIVSSAGQYVLVVYVRRQDGLPAAVTRARIGNRTVPYQRVTVSDGVEGGLIPQSSADMARAASNGMNITLCGALGCYSVSVPATLYQQALLE